MMHWKLIVSLILVNVTMAATLNSNKKTPTVTTVNNKFVDSKGFQFYMKGIAYQRMREEDDGFDDAEGFGYIDPLANTTTCLRDLQYLEQLGVNVVRVYQIDPNKDHDVCMDAFADKGIYVLLDLAEPETSINRNKPTWDVEIFDRYKSVIDATHKYDNILGYFAGNEVSNSVGNTDASPFVRAAVRDIKDYIDKQNYRKIPVGYSSNDDARIRTDLANYFVCGDDKNSQIDFFGLNMYEWCGYSTYTTSGYRDRTLEFEDYPVPVFFSEYGCNTVNPRPFTEVEALYGLTMSKVWSGGIVYEYFQHRNNYGVVKENKDGTVEPLEDFNTLSLRLTNNNLKRTKAKESSPLNKTVSCTSSEYWNVSQVLPPTPDNGKCECIQSTYNCILTPFKKVHQHNLLTEICSKIDCSEISSKPLEGEYGAFSDCSLDQRISFALNKYYNAKGKKEESCDFDGRAILVSNNDEADLKSIILRDGRTCKETLSELVNLGPKHESGKHSLPKANGKFYGDSSNRTHPMSSTATLKSKIFGFYSLIIYLVSRYLVQ